MHELICIREVIKEIQTFFISGKTENPKYLTHSKEFFLNNTPTSKFYEDNEACLKFSTFKHIYPRTKHISLPYHCFCSKSKALKIDVLSINTNDQLAEQFTKGLQEGKFGLARKALMKGWLMKGGYLWYWDVYALTHGSRQIRGCMRAWTHCVAMVIFTSVIDTCTW